MLQKAPVFLCGGLPRTGAGQIDELGKQRTCFPEQHLLGSSPGADCPSVLPASRGAPIRVLVGRAWLHSHHQWFHPHYQPREETGRLRHQHEWLVTGSQRDFINLVVREPCQSLAANEGNSSQKEHSVAFSSSLSALSNINKYDNV